MLTSLIHWLKSNHSAPFFLIATVLASCTTAGQPEPLVGEPVYFRHISDDVFWENFVVYGSLERNVLRKPTEVYYSAFGHSYCMVEEVSFKVIEYIQGSGPTLIEFEEHIADSCRPIAESIGFNESILFISKNEHRGTWHTGGIKLQRFDGEVRIFKPLDILRFMSFDNFESLLTDYDEPFEWAIQLGILGESDLVSLSEKGVLDFEHDSSVGEGIYKVNMHKYISLEQLLENDF